MKNYFIVFMNAWKVFTFNFVTMMQQLNVFSLLFLERRNPLLVSLFYCGKTTPESKDLPNIYSNCVFYSQIVHPGTFTQCDSDLEASE